MMRYAVICGSNNLPPHVKRVGGDQGWGEGLCLVETTSEEHSAALMKQIQEWWESVGGEEAGVWDWIASISDAGEEPYSNLPKEQIELIIEKCFDDDLSCIVDARDNPHCIN